MSDRLTGLTPLGAQIILCSSLLLYEYYKFTQKCTTILEFLPSSTEFLRWRQICGKNHLPLFVHILVKRRKNAALLFLCLYTKHVLSKGEAEMKGKKSPENISTEIHEEG